MQRVPQTPAGAEMAGVLLVVAATLFVLSVISLKKGKTIRTKVVPGESRYIYREEDPIGFWYSFSLIAGVGVFALAVAIWVLYYGYR